MISFFRELIFKPKEVYFLIIAFTLFSRRLFKYKTFIDIDFYAYPVYIILFVFLFYTLKISLRYAILLFFFCCFSSIVFLSNHDSYFNLIKTVIPFLFIYTTFYSYFKNYSILGFFKTYLKLSVWVALIGYLQVILKVFFAINIFSRYASFALHSIVTEPSHYVLVILPATVFCFLKYKEYKYWFWVLFISLILTFKLTAFISILIVFLIARKVNILNFLIFIFLFFISLNYLIEFEEYSYRLIPVINYFFGDGTLEYSQRYLAGTPLSFVSNLNVAIDVALSNFFGGGIGSHPLSYDEYFSKNAWIGYDYNYGLNKNSGHSLIIRIISEFGFFIPLVIISYIIIKFNKIKTLSLRKIILISCFSHFIAKFIKLGAYIDFGTPIFFSIIILLIANDNKIE